MKRSRITQAALAWVLLGLILGGATTLANDPAYSTTGGSMYDILINPFPNQAPYIATLPTGEQIFNPFAIEEVRFSLHLLLDRTAIAAEMPDADCIPAFVPANLSESDPCHLGSLAQELGISYQANTAIALASIRLAMEQAATLPENESRLVRGDDRIWEWDGVDISIPFGIRSDHAVQNAMGHQVADAIELAGFVVERLEQDAGTLMPPIYTTALNELAWRIVTEAWGGGEAGQDATFAFLQYFVPSKATYGSMVADPGTAWRYENTDVEQAAQVLETLTSADDGYCEELELVVRGSLQDAVRIIIGFKMN